MKIVKYDLSLIHKKELILTMEDDVNSEDLLKIFLETQMKEEKEQDGLLGIIAEKVSEIRCLIKYGSITCKIAHCATLSGK